MNTPCSNIPDSIVVIFKSISSGNLLTFFGLIIALLIPFAIFLIDNSNKTEEEKDFAKVERAVILERVMHVRILIITIFVGGIASLLFIDNMPCKLTNIILNFIYSVIIIITTMIIMWIIKDIVLWMLSSTKADNTESFCFKKWKDYLEKIDDQDFYDTWNRIFGNKKLPEALQPAYLSIFFERSITKKPSEEHMRYRIIYNNFNNVQIYNPSVLKIVIDNIAINSSSIFLLNKIRNGCGLDGDFDILMDYLNKRLQKDNNNRETEIIIKDFFFNGIRHFFNEPAKEKAFVNAIPISWKLNSLLQRPNNISKIIATFYPSLVIYLLGKQDGKNIWFLEHVNTSVVGNIVDDNLNERLLADICEIYDNSYRIILAKDSQTPEQKLIEDYQRLEPRYFANSSIYTIIMDKNGKESTRESERRQCNNTLKIINFIFPDIITNRNHINNMQKEIKKQLKEQPEDYRLQRLSTIYKIISDYLPKDR